MKKITKTEWKNEFNQLDFSSHETFMVRNAQFDVSPPIANERPNLVSAIKVLNI